MFAAVSLLCRAATPGDAAQLPISGVRIVNVSSEPQLQAAFGNLRDGDTIVLADGTYDLTGILTINNRQNVTIRGASGSTNVVLAGKGMDNRNHGGVLHAIWSNSTNTTIAHLTIRDTYDNPIIFNSGAQSPRVYSVRLVDAGSQFIKANPTDVNAGLGVNNGRVEYCVFEYTTRPPNDHGAGVGYFNGISAHAADNWVIRGNLFKNLHNPDGTDYPWNPAVLFWRNSSNTVTEQNTFINVDRAVAYGLDHTTPFRDHSGGVIRNNFIYLEPGLLTAGRKQSSDGSIIVWNSPGTQVDHNTVLVNGNEFYAIEFRFATTTGAAARNNLTDAPIHRRDNADATLSGNLTSATPQMFVNPGAGDLHLRPAAASAINKAPPLGTVTNDFDGELRPAGSNADLGADELSLVRPVINGFEVGGGEAIIQFSTVPDQSYFLERAENLSNAWTVASSNGTGSGATLEFRDVAPAVPQRFYRIRSIP